jgi:hypothetical protein
MIRVEIKPAGKGRHHWRCDLDGASLSGVSSEPLLAACREIKRMGGGVGMQCGLFREGHSEWDLRCSVGWGASHTVHDTHLEVIPPK